MQFVRRQGELALVLLFWKRFVRIYADKKILLLIEELNPAATNIEQRVKRKRFYLRNGYIDTGIRTSSVGGNMEILSAGGMITGEEYLSIQRYNMGRLFMALGRNRVQ